MFKLDSEVKNEALNFATLMNVFAVSEQHFDPKFNELSNRIDITIPLNDKTVIGTYTSFFNIEETILLKEYAIAKEAFMNLRATDEIIKRGSQDYPPLLEKTKQAPRFLYIRGNKSLFFERRTVALVGSRKASERAKKNTIRLTNELGYNGITIISGLAKGIDVTAHKEALNHGYNTIAVIGTNLNQYYPYENKKVQLMIEEKGLVVSQFSPASKTQNWFFPLRNSVMSGLSLATVIMEAGETSGALKQADYALKQGREVIIPKSALEMESINWPEKYVQKGAKVATTPKDVLKILAESNIYKTNTNRQETIEDILNIETNNTEQIRTKWISQMINGD